jgi:cytochrome c biogenesis protein CcdA
MFLLVLAYVGGVLTILSPCILPVLPFVFARSDQPFRKNGLPLLAGMAVTFALVASLATVGGGWAVRANQFGRIAALALFGLFGLTLIFSSLAERLSRPLVRLGNRLSQNSDAGSSVANSFLLGIGYWPSLGTLRRPHSRTQSFSFQVFRRTPSPSAEKSV